MDQVPTIKSKPENFIEENIAADLRDLGQDKDSFEHKEHKL